MRSVVAASADHRLAARRFEVERWVAGAAVLVSFAQVPFRVGPVTIASVFVVALAPVWLASLRKFGGAVVFVLASALAVGFGAVMAMLAAPERDVLPYGAVEFAVLIVTIVGRVGILLWARTRLSTPTVAILAGIALLATVSRQSTLYPTNPWKFGFVLPVSVFALAVAWRIGLRWIEIVVLLVLAGVSATNDARSSAAIIGLAVLIVAWQTVRSGSASGRQRWAGTAIVVVGLGWVVYHAVQAVILAGLLGQSTQERTRVQLETGGSLLLGGRPELAASLALARDTPWGFGLGVQPTLHDILVAKSGMASINYDPNNGYVENYMLGSGFALHSVVADLWASLGAGGLVMCAVLVFVAFRAVLVRVRLTRASGLVALLACHAAWALPFGPLRSSITVLSLLVGLALIPTGVDQAAWDDPVDSPHDG